ncbi:hypothetical protein [Massilia sp. BSC265]|uniref:hypothetical protein n=1 Tax=Massilia sp. BSC265 TaxID=1549812 RepID=UPI0004E888CE|nr:hypothetical protein [Massilia sp. BSC265]KFI07439.1 hypothetical protein JN27_07415 [Massilia sp. BSC265]
MKLYGGPPGSRPDTGGHTISGNVLDTITSNLFAGTTGGGIHLDASSSDVVARNNIYRGTPFALTGAAADEAQVQPHQPGGSSQVQEAQRQTRTGVMHTDAKKPA